MYTKDCQINTYHAICRKYPHIRVNKKEDLNIENNILKILEKCWYDKDRYGHVGDIDRSRLLLTCSLGRNFP